MEIIHYVIIGVVFLLFLAFFILVDNAFDKLGDWFFRKIGLQSGKGPLEATARSQGDKIYLLLENQGKDKIKLLAVEGHDASNQRKFPVPYLSENELGAGSASGSRQKQFAKVALAYKEVQQVIIDAKEVTDMGCQSLAVLDHSGHAWPVTGFNSPSSH